jgi:hypothetical protein
MTDQVIDDLSRRIETTGQLSARSNKILSGSTGWIKFAAMIGFVSVGFSVLMMIYKFGNPALPAGAFGQISKMTSTLVSVISNSIGLVTSIVLLRYANKLKVYTDGGRSSDLREAFSKQKTYYLIVGILLIFYLSIVVLAIACIPLIMSLMHK